MAASRRAGASRSVRRREIADGREELARYRAPSFPGANSGGRAGGWRACASGDGADRAEQQFNLCELEIVLKSGARKTFRVEYHRGHFKNPMTDAEMEEKFRLMAQKHLAADRVDNLLCLLWGVESLPQVSTLIAATVV